MLGEIFGVDGIVVVIVLAVVLFGGAAIPKLARNIGSAKNQFEKGLEDGKKATAPERSFTSTRRQSRHEKLSDPGAHLGSGRSDPERVTFTFAGSPSPSRLGINVEQGGSVVPLFSDAGGRDDLNRGFGRARAAVLPECGVG